jgi:hypothetical protein
MDQFMNIERLIMESKNTKNRNLELLKEIFELYKNSNLKISETSEISFVAGEINKRLEQIENEYKKKLYGK